MVVSPPSPPTGLDAQFPIAIQPAASLTNLSMPQKGNFLGFSVELSVVGQILGLNSSFLAPPFLNYIANLKERIGFGPSIRVGGNTQDQSTMYDYTFPDKYGHPQMVYKWYDTVNGNPTGTPNINFAEELIYTMGNITGLLGTTWFFGLQFDQPYNDSNALVVAETIETVLGDHLISLQLGNEPDLYASHLRRPSNYSIQDYFTEFQSYLGNLEASPTPNKKIILGPSVCCDWTTDQVFEAGYLSQFGNYLNVVGLMHYPNNNCAIGGAIAPQDALDAYLTHQSALTFAQLYSGVIPEAEAAGLPLVLLETNTASCGGFPGISDAFTAPLWAIDNALMLASVNLTNMMLHIGGQSDSYNPFTPPPGNMSAYSQWTTGAIYYATLAVAEAIGSSNLSQIIDMQTSSEFRPAYAIYESGVPTRVALFNYASDDTGASDYQAVVTLAGATVPAEVYVRYLSAPSIAEKFNITWAGQTMGGVFQSDGRLQGTQVTETIECDTTNNQCLIPMRAPSFALVFLSQSALTASSPSTSSTLTFATTSLTKKVGAGNILVNPAVLATMNGEGGPGTRYLGSTGKSNASAGARQFVIPAMGSLLGLAIGCVLAAGLR
ncbi:hypothetical protein FRB96_000193 [Tulasnella sp. 330]|nr:hypothetical protein FRB96_000193 [Tulasnella sp. 330]KAG8891097.1 hypothetical protein FRB98_000106 [Tulasnella sp. 332]